MDIFSFVNTLNYEELSTKKASEPSVEIRKRVIKTRQIQTDRFKGDKIYCNAQMEERHLKKFCELTNDGKNIIKNIFDKFQLSTRAYSRILKVSRTIADMHESDKITSSHIIEATQYRKFIDKKIL